MTMKAEPNPKVFPKIAVQTILGDWWNSKTKSPLKKPKPQSEARSQGGNVFDIQPELSSQQAVGVLLDLKDCLGYEPKPKKVIKRGGYSDCAEFFRAASAMRSKRISTPIMASTKNKPPKL